MRHTTYYDATKILDECVKNPYLSEHYFIELQKNPADRNMTSDLFTGMEMKTITTVTADNKGNRSVTVVANVDTKVNTKVLAAHAQKIGATANSLKTTFRSQRKTSKKLRMRN